VVTGVLGVVLLEAVSHVRLELERGRVDPVYVFVVAAVDGVEVVEAQNVRVWVGPRLDEAEVLVARLLAPADAKALRSPTGFCSGWRYCRSRHSGA
jgi:hypothetical protein